MSDFCQFDNLPTPGSGPSRLPCQTGRQPWSPAALPPSVRMPSGRLRHSVSWFSRDVPQKRVPSNGALARERSNSRDSPRLSDLRRPRPTPCLLSPVTSWRVPNPPPPARQPGAPVRGRGAPGCSTAHHPYGIQACPPEASIVCTRRLLTQRLKDTHLRHSRPDVVPFRLPGSDTNPTRIGHHSSGTSRRSTLPSAHRQPALDHLPARPKAAGGIIIKPQRIIHRPGVIIDFLRAVRIKPV